MIKNITTLPDELIRKVAYFSNKGNVTSMRGVCKGMKALVDQDESIHLPTTQYPIDQSKIKLIKEADSTTPIPIPPLLINRVQTLSGHTECVNSVAGLEGGLLASGSYDKTIKIWDLNTGQCVQTLEGYIGVNEVIELKDGRLASALDHSSIKIWDLNTGQCVQTLSGHRGHVNSVIELNDGRLASASDDQTIKIWGETDIMRTRDKAARVIQKQARHYIEKNKGS